MASQQPPQQVLPHERRVGPGLRLAATLAAFAVLAWLVDVPAALAELVAADPAAVAAALVLVQVQVVLSSWRWRLVAGRLGIRLPFGAAVAEYYLAGLLNMILPGGVPGDALRAVRLRLSGAYAWSAVVRSVVLERVAGQVALATVVLAGLAAWPMLLDDRMPAAAGWLVATAVGLGLLVAAAAAVLSRLGPLRSALAGTAGDAWAALVAGGAWAAQSVLNLAIVASYIAAFALAALALGQPLPWPALVTVVPLVLLSMAVPLTVGGWGVREGAAAGLWPLLGMEPAMGFATAALYGLIVLIGSLPGAAFLVRRAAAPAN